MPFKRLSTQKVARRVGVHPNTVRLYETWGLIAPVPRSPAGYRLFTEMHVYQMRLARIMMGAPWVGRDIRRAGLRIIKLAVADDLSAALEAAWLHGSLVRQEREQAEAAASLLHHWAQNERVQANFVETYLIGQVARLLHLTLDTLRNWERNGLLSVARDPQNRYRRYTPADIDRLRIIRMLLRSGYSLMAVHRALSFLDQGREEDIVTILDTPLPGEEIFTAADHWLSSLDEQEQRGLQVIALLEEMQALSAHDEIVRAQGVPGPKIIPNG